MARAGATFQLARIKGEVPGRDHPADAYGLADDEIVRWAWNGDGIEHLFVRKLFEHLGHPKE